MATTNDIAFVVGLDHYKDSPLTSCANDATRMAELLAQNDDPQHSQNFSVENLIPERQEDMPTRTSFLNKLQDVLGPRDIAYDFLFYFSGHGATHDWGTELVIDAADGRTERVAMDEVLTLINQSDVRQAVVILDCCFAGTFASIAVLAPGGAGQRGFAKGPAIVRPNLMVLAAASPLQPAYGGYPYSPFTELLIAGLEGGAANHKGEISPQALFGYAAPAFGPLDQRPTFKANMSASFAIRTCTPRVEIRVLRELKNYFAGGEVVLSPDDVVESGNGPTSADQQRYLDLLQLREAGLLQCPDYRHLAELAAAGASVKLSVAGIQLLQLSVREKL